MKYLRMVYMGEMGGDQLVVFPTLEAAKKGTYPDARGIGAHGPVYEITGRVWQEVPQALTTWVERPA